MIRLGLALAALLIAITPARAQPAAETVTIYEGAQVLDIASGAWRDVSIVVRGERIAALLRPGEAAPGHTERIDMAGRWAIPGLIDVHVHITTGMASDDMARELARNLHGGVTAVRDMAGDARILAHLARDARLGAIAAPDIYYAALAAGPSFFDDERTADAAQGVAQGEVPWLMAITQETDLAETVALMRGSGASGIKIYANLPSDLVAALIAEAHRQRIPVWAHGAVFPTTPMQEVTSGANTLSHVCMLAYQTLDPPPASYDYADRGALDETRLMGPPVPEMAALWAAMAERGTVLDTTLWVYRTIERLRAEMTASAAPAEPEFLPPIYCSSRLAEHLAAQAAAAGVTLAAGTDAPGLESDRWPGLYEELLLLRDAAGLAPIEVIRAATVNAARAIGQEDERGTIEPGRLADMVFLSADPLAADAELRTVELTVKRGRRYWRRDYTATGAAM